MWTAFGGGGKGGDRVPPAGPVPSQLMHQCPRLRPVRVQCRHRGGEVTDTHIIRGGNVHHQYALACTEKETVPGVEVPEWKQWGY